MIYRRKSLGVISSKKLFIASLILISCGYAWTATKIADDLEFDNNNCKPGMFLNGKPLKFGNGEKFIATNNLIIGQHQGITSNNGKCGIINVPMQTNSGTVSVSAEFAMGMADWIGVGFTAKSGTPINNANSSFWTFVNKSGNVTLYHGRQWLFAKKISTFDKSDNNTISLTYSFETKRVKVELNSSLIYEAMVAKDVPEINFAQIEMQNPTPGVTVVKKLEIVHTSAVSVQKPSNQVKIDTCGKAAENDTLQDVLPEVNRPDAVWLNLVAGLVDGGSSQTISLLGPPNPENGTKVFMRHAPISFTWDLGSVCNEMSTLQILLPGKKNYSLTTQISTSQDGRTFTVIPGSRVSHSFAKLKDFHKTMHRIGYSFVHGEAKAFRYLRVEFPEQCAEDIEIQEIDAFISGCNPHKYTGIDTVIKSISTKTTEIKHLSDQTITQPVRPQNISFSNLGKLRCGDIDILDITPFWQNEKDQAVITKTLNGSSLKTTVKYPDGRIKTIEAKIVNQLLSITIEISADVPVSFPGTTINFNESACLFDGVTNGTGPSYIDRRNSGLFFISPNTPYFIFPSHKHGMELHFFMPNWYNTIAQVTTFNNKHLISFELFGASENNIQRLDSKSGIHSSNKWNPIPLPLKRDTQLRWQINVAVFPITPPTLGSSDIENTKAFNPLRGIFIGTGNQTAIGRPRVIHAEKMRFIGFKLPDMQMPKPGNHLEIEPWMDLRSLSARLSASGVGIVTQFSDYRDVSHGISHQGNYDICPPGFEDMLQKTDQSGIKVLSWCSPRGFLQKDWGQRKKDKIVEKHPEWFTNHSHWFGAYRTINPFLTAPNEWIENKIKDDFRKYPLLGGVCFDTFPLKDLVVDSSSQQTLLSTEMKWLTFFTEIIRNYPSQPAKISMINATTPCYDEYQRFDYGGSEHPLRMFLNETTNGKVPFGHPFVPWEYYGQLYFWYSPLGHMYYNFCDYNQGVGWVGPLWVGMMPKQMRKDYEKQVAPIWYIMGKANRIFGAQIMPDIRHIEAIMPDKSVVMIICSISPNKAAPLQVVAKNVKPGTYDLNITIDTAKEHKDIIINGVNVPGHGLQINDLPPYSMMICRFVEK